MEEGEDLLERVPVAADDTGGDEEEREHRLVEARLPCMTLHIARGGKCHQSLDRL